MCLAQQVKYANDGNTTLIAWVMTVEVETNAMAGPSSCSRRRIASDACTLVQKNPDLIVVSIQKVSFCSLVEFVIVSRLWY